MNGQLPRRVYICGPIGDLAGRSDRVRDAITMGELLARDGFAVYVPHLCSHWNELYEHDKEFWLAFNLPWLALSEAVFRLPGASAGADREVAFATARNMPVFTDVSALRRWARETDQSTITRTAVEHVLGAMQPK